MSKNERILLVALVAIMFTAGVVILVASLDRENDLTPVLTPIPKVTSEQMDGIRSALAGGTDVAGEGGWSFDLAGWIRPLEREALRAFIEDAPRLDHPNERNQAPAGEVLGWKGPFNTCGYGIGTWVLQASQRYGYEPGFTWLRAHCNLNVRNYWIYFAVKGRGPNEGVGYRWETSVPSWVSRASELSGIPVGELVHYDQENGYLVPEADKWDGSSYGRHHCYDFLAHCLLEPRVGLSSDEAERVAAMLTHYAQDRTSGDPPNVTHRHEYAHYYVRTYAAIYRAFKQLYLDSDGNATNPERWEAAKRCLQAAEGIVWYGFDPRGPGRPHGVKGRDGSIYWTWDPGQPDDPYWHQLNQIHSEKPWYPGLRASAWAYLWMEPDCSQWIRDLIGWVIREEARWCSRDWKSLPPCSLAPDDLLGSAANGWIHGGTLPGPEGDRWIRSDSKILTPDAWAALDRSTPYHPLTAILARESDNGYFMRWWPDDVQGGYLRYHYPKINIEQNTWPDDFGPRLDMNGGASWAGMPDVLFLAGLLEGDPEKVKTAAWLCHDYLAFSHLNWGGADLLQPKSKATDTWYGGLHKTRSFAWIVMCGEILRACALDGGLERLVNDVRKKEAKDGNQ